LFAVDEKLCGSLCKMQLQPEEQGQTRDPCGREGTAQLLYSNTAQLLYSNPAMQLGGTYTCAVGTARKNIWASLSCSVNSYVFSRNATGMETLQKKEEMH